MVAMVAQLDQVRYRERRGLSISHLIRRMMPTCLHLRIVKADLKRELTKSQVRCARPGDETPNNYGMAELNGRQSREKAAFLRKWQ